MSTSSSSSDSSSGSSNSNFTISPESPISLQSANSPLAESSAASLEVPLAEPLSAPVVPLGAPSVPLVPAAPVSTSSDESAASSDTSSEAPSNASSFAIEESPVSPNDVSKESDASPIAPVVEEGYNTSSESEASPVSPVVEEGSNASLESETSPVIAEDSRPSESSNTSSESDATSVSSNESPEELPIAPVVSSVAESVRRKPRVGPSFISSITPSIAAVSKVESAAPAAVSKVESSAPAALPRVLPRKKPVMGKLPAPSRYSSLPDSDLMAEWDTQVDNNERDAIIKVMKARNLFPSEDIKKWESDTGAYPDIVDPQFLQKLLLKREFAESLQYTWKPETNPCDDQTTFEVTPVQRFVTNFMSPKTPYMSALLFHGVGVGKTCAGVQIMEAWLETYPNDPVYLIAPNTIQHGFIRTIFDITKVTIGQEGEPNTASQCTGTNYMKMTNTLYERDKGKIERAVQRMIYRRYRIFGYISFANYILKIIDEGIPRGITEEERLLFRKKNIRKHFSGKLLIVDEAHNLRDIAGTEQKVDDIGSKEDDDNSAGKILTPLLIDVLQYSEGMKFCALTATPMYNSYLEIIFILNLLLMNDKKATITAPDVFDTNGTITPRGKEILSATAQHYVSFMRGENPISFPIRLFPQDIPPLPRYPAQNPRGAGISEEETKYITRLPIVPISLQGDTMRASIQFMNQLPEGDTGLNTVMLEKLVHAGNFIVPATEETKGDTVEAYTRRTDSESLMTVFHREGSGTNTRYRAKPGIGASWLSANRLMECSPKFSFFLERIRNTKGCIFAYTRFVTGGALPMALILEANGYTPYHGKALLSDGIQAPGGKQCSQCHRKQQEHVGVSHAFSPAYYGLLTGNTDISPQNDAAIRRQRDISNKDGSQLKVIIGSQIASEGVDLRFIRETHIIDSWFHLNKTEQIIGRAIRFLSHCALPVKERNTTIYLYAAVLPSDSRETADLYSYRTGFKKAVLIGNVTRVLKQAAVDCNLNKDAIVIHDEDPVEQIDSQRKQRDAVNINDMPFTAICDWIETCTYECTPTVAIPSDGLDESTYDEYSARWRVHQLKEFIRNLFAEQPFYQLEDMMNQFSMTKTPRSTIQYVLHEIVNRKTFQVRHKGVPGYIRYCNGYYLFQPSTYADTSLPIAIRTARFPIKRDDYLPIIRQKPQYRLEEEKKEEVVRTTSSEALWIAMEKWVTKLAEHKGYHQPPYEMKQHTESSIHGTDMALMYQYVLEMIQLFYESFDVYHHPAAFRTAVLSYLWDEWLTFEEQRELIDLHVAHVDEFIQENRIAYGSDTYFRFMNPKTQQMDIICGDGKPCNMVVLSEMDRYVAQDPIRTNRITRETTGPIYGFMVPKKDGTMMFKTNHPPSSGSKVERGKQCVNESNKLKRLAYLIQIGHILREAHGTECHLDEETLVKSKNIKNSIRPCTLMNLFLRFLDAERVNQKRWFFRPVESYYTGHR